MKNKNKNKMQRFIGTLLLRQRQNESLQNALVLDMVVKVQEKLKIFQKVYTAALKCIMRVGVTPKQRRLYTHFTFVRVKTIS